MKVVLIHNPHPELSVQNVDVVTCEAESDSHPSPDCHRPHNAETRTWPDYRE